MKSADAVEVAAPCPAPAAKPVAAATAMVRSCSRPASSESRRHVPSCHGIGQVITDPCDQCRGRGHVARRVELEVAIPAGVDDGMRVRLTGEGERSRDGGPPGDCYCFIRVLPHPLFKREGSHLFVEVPISYTQAALGAEIEIPTLDATDRLTIPPGTQSGEVFRLQA